MFSGNKPRHDEYDAELRELERKTQQVKAHAAALQREREHAAALEQQRPVQRSYDGRMPLVSPTLFENVGPERNLSKTPLHIHLLSVLS